MFIPILRRNQAGKSNPLNTRVTFLEPQRGDERVEFAARDRIAGGKQADHAAQDLLVGFDSVLDAIDDPSEQQLELDAGLVQTLLVRGAPQDQRQ